MSSRRESRRIRENRPSPFVGTTQTKIVGVLALATLALSFAVALKTSNFGAAFIAFVVGALVLLLTLFDLNCISVGKDPRTGGWPGCGVWSIVKSILVGIALIGAILLAISALSAPSRPAPQPVPIAPMPVPLIPQTA